MDTNNKNIAKNWPLLVVFLLLVIAITWAFTDKSINKPYTIAINADPSAPQTHSQADYSAHANEPVTLETIVKYRRTWAPVFTRWHGKKVPDITFADLQEKTHKLSEYNGKDVLLLFWATWCGPCKVEIPHLIELRKQKSPDELAIIAISSEDRSLLKRFAAANQLNYTVATLSAAPPRPFAEVRSIPTTFYIDKQHNIKFATEGAVSMMETMAIIQAEK